MDKIEIEAKIAKYEAEVKALKDFADKYENKNLGITCQSQRAKIPGIQKEIDGLKLLIQ